MRRDAVPRLPSATGCRGDFFIELKVLRFTVYHLVAEAQVRRRTLTLFFGMYLARVLSGRCAPGVPGVMVGASESTCLHEEGTRK